MIGVEMGDEDQVKRLEADPGIGQSARDAEPAIDNNGSSADLEQRGARPWSARPDRRTALGAEQDETFRTLPALKTNRPPACR
jgi:hypothetical protein